MPLPDIMAELVDRYRRNEAAYRSGQYNETLVRRDFIDPMFACLGWDMNNSKGYAQAYREVIHEDAIDVDGSRRAPDYCFRVGGVRKFFLEAKKPAVNVRDDVGPAYQLRRYAWSAKLPLGILTDFEEFAVYDCRTRPLPADKPSAHRVMYLTYADYEKHWDEIAARFSREAILKGAFDKFAESTQGKRGTAAVDAAFLAEIEAWRDTLARNIALRNPGIGQRALNDAVQRTIDRIIFLRLCEDRGIEDYGRLQKIAAQKGVYDELKTLFQQADDRYNSGLFHFQAEKGRADHDRVSLKLAIDDKVLKPILGGLYYPDSPYEFSVLPADILGQVYEQFLGKVIRLTSGHQAKVEEKPEVRKAGGVYYTPTYIVDYIVKNTVGKLLEGKKPADIDGSKRGAAPLRVLDPACGSGSFLIVAYQYLLDWHLAAHTAKNPEKLCKGKNPRLRQRGKNDFVLTVPERKRILLDHIYGVDIDPQAVEVTKLSLLLKVLEGETAETLGLTRELIHERALPDLGNNIKCGNSLIGPDFYHGHQDDAFDTEEMFRINAFDWKQEFPFIVKDGGFDAVIGNPPYVRQEGLKQYKDYLRRHYKAFISSADLYVYFMERAASLLKRGGRFSFVVSSSFLRTTFGEPLRVHLKNSIAVRRIVDFGGLPVFAAAKDTYVCIPIFAGEPQGNKVEVVRVTSLEPSTIQQQLDAVSYLIPASRLTGDSWSLCDDRQTHTFTHIQDGAITLGKYIKGKMFYGLKTGFNDAFVIDETTMRDILTDSPMSQSLMRPFIGGEDVRRYMLRSRSIFLIAIPSGWTRKEMTRRGCSIPQLTEKSAWEWFSKAYPAIAGHLSGFEQACRNRQDKGEFWWELRACDYYDQMADHKIVFPDICKAPRFFLDRSGGYIANTAYFLATKDLYLLGILNSRLFWFAIGNISIPFGMRAGKYRYRLIYQYMEKVPIRPLDLTDKTDKTNHDKMVSLVTRMLSLHERLPQAATEHEGKLLQRQITATDQEIDQLVYALYGLTEDEISIVEGAG